MHNIYVFLKFTEKVPGEIYDLNMCNCHNVTYYFNINGELCLDSKTIILDKFGIIDEIIESYLYQNNILTEKVYKTILALI